MNLTARYSYESSGLCFAPLPELLWTPAARFEELADLMDAIERTFTGRASVFAYYRRPQVSAPTCMDEPLPLQGPRYCHSLFNLDRCT